MINDLIKKLDASPSSYHLIDNVATDLLRANFKKLELGRRWSLSRGDSAFVVIDGSALIAFKIGEKITLSPADLPPTISTAHIVSADPITTDILDFPINPTSPVRLNPVYSTPTNPTSTYPFIRTSSYSYSIVASHTDSPCFKLKTNPIISDGTYRKLNIEEYGKGLQYTWFDRPLQVAGRIIAKNNTTNRIESVLVRDPRLYCIPSLAIHLNREANRELKLNVRKDIVPLMGIQSETDYVDSLLKSHILDIAIAQQNAINLQNKRSRQSQNQQNPTVHDYSVIDYDLFLTSAQEAFLYGEEEEFLCAPRLDNQTSAIASIRSLIAAKPENIAVAFLADNEEVGSRTKQGAGATILRDVITRINNALGYDEEDLHIALANSFMLSCDNSHARHPNYPEMSDDTNRNYLTKGIVIKHHASQSYTTDAVSSALIKQMLERAGVSYQDFYNRADLPSGGTLGAISSSQLSIRSIDIGLPQLAMHSSSETISPLDYTPLIKALTYFYTYPL